jgi:hypothetical protein
MSTITHTMRNQYATHTDFRDFQGLIPENTHFLPSNIDMICERKGHFLIGEWKKPNEKMATGQQLLLKAFAQVPKFTVLVIIGNTDNEQTEVGEVFQVILGKCVKIGEGLDFLKDFYVMWYEFANSKG